MQSPTNTIPNRHRHLRLQPTIHIIINKFPKLLPNISSSPLQKHPLNNIPNIPTKFPKLHLKLPHQIIQLLQSTNILNNKILTNQPLTKTPQHFHTIRNPLLMITRDLTLPSRLSRRSRTPKTTFISNKLNLNAPPSTRILHKPRHHTLNKHTS